MDELFLFTGRPYDGDTELQNNWHRWYDGKLGKWIAEDPITFRAEDANLGRYVQNQPQNFADSDGLKLNPIFHNNVSNRDATYKRVVSLLNRLAEKHAGTIAGKLARIALGHDKIVTTIKFQCGLNNAYGKHNGGAHVVMLDPTNDTLLPKRIPAGFNLTRKGWITDVQISDDEIAMIVIAHELGHALIDLDDPILKTPRGANVTFIENELRAAMGVALRTEYDPSARDVFKNRIFVPKTERQCDPKEITKRDKFLQMFNAWQLGQLQLNKGLKLFSPSPISEIPSVPELDFKTKPLPSIPGPSLQDLYPN